PSAHRDRLDVHLKLAGLIGLVGHPFSVRRKPRDALISGRTEIGGLHMIAISQKQSDVEASLCNTHKVNNEFSFGRNICRRGGTCMAPECFFLTPDTVVRTSMLAFIAPILTVQIRRLSLKFLKVLGLVLPTL